MKILLHLCSRLCKTNPTTRWIQGFLLNYAKTSLIAFFAHSKTLHSNSTETKPNTSQAVMISLATLPTITNSLGGYFLALFPHCWSPTFLLLLVLFCTVNCAAWIDPTQNPRDRVSLPVWSFDFSFLDIVYFVSNLVCLYFNYKVRFRQHNCLIGFRNHRLQQ